MTHYRTLLISTLAVAVIGSAQAGGLNAVEAMSIDLGSVAGVAYYTVEHDGYHVVATLSQPGDTMTPIRLETVLAPGQSVKLSTPHNAGSAAETVEIIRQNDQVVVHRAGLTN